MTNGLFPHFRHPNWVWRCWGFRDPTLGLVHVHLIPVSSGTITSPPLPGGQLEGPPEAAWVLPPVEAGPPLWRGVDEFLLGLEAVVIPLWLEVGSHPLWFGVGVCPLGFGMGACPLPPGAGCVLPEVPVDGVLVWASFGGSGLPLGCVLGSLGTGCPAR